MFCNTQFTHSQLQHIGLTKSFLLGDFAKHQQDVLFAQEQAMLPAAQAAVAHDRLIKDIVVVMVMRLIDLLNSTFIPKMLSIFIETIRTADKHLAKPI